MNEKKMISELETLRANEMKVLGNINADEGSITKYNEQQ